MSNSIQRRCKNCNTWNDEIDFCTNCGSIISIKESEKIEAKEKAIIEANKPKDKIDLFVEKYKNHKFLPIRFIFYIFYSVWLVFMGIGSFLAWAVAWAAG